MPTTKPSPRIKRLRWNNVKQLRAVLEHCANIAETEPEAPGGLPQELLNYPIEDIIRAAIRATKKNIAANIRAAVEGK